MCKCVTERNQSMSRYDVISETLLHLQFLRILNCKVPHLPGTFQPPAVRLAGLQARLARQHASAPFIQPVNSVEFHSILLMIVRTATSSKCFSELTKPRNDGIRDSRPIIFTALLHHVLPSSRSFQCRSKDLLPC